MKKFNSNLLIAFACAGILTSCKIPETYKGIFKIYENALQPVPFAEELALPNNTYKGSFSHDYKAFYFFRKQTPDTEDYRIFQSSFLGHQWKEPNLIDFSDSNSDIYTMVSSIQPDTLFFTSYRRLPGDTSTKTNSNFWFSVMQQGRWGNPKPIILPGLVQNYNSQPSMADNGNIYFSSTSPDWNTTWTYKMEYRDGVYQTPVLFDFVNNLRSTDTTHTYHEICISPKEDYMIMVISKRGQEPKLFLSNFRSGIWQSPRDLGELVNADMAGNFPYITRDGRFLIFTKKFSAFYIFPTKRFTEIK